MNIPTRSDAVLSDSAADECRPADEFTSGYHWLTNLGKWKQIMWWSSPTQMWIEGAAIHGPREMRLYGFTYWAPVAPAPDEPAKGEAAS